MAYKYFLSGLLPNTLTPSGVYGNEFQAFVNDSFDIATDVYNVDKETSLGSGVYDSISIRINHAIA